MTSGSRGGRGGGRSRRIVVEPMRAGAPDPPHSANHHAPAATVSDPHRSPTRGRPTNRTPGPGALASNRDEPRPAPQIPGQVAGPRGEQPRPGMGGVV